MLFNEEKQEVSTSSESYANYEGIASREIICVNPTAKENKELFGRDSDEEPVYVKKVTINDKEIDRVTLLFKGRIIPAPISFTGVTCAESNLNNFFNLDKEYVVSSDGSKYQFIDDYGRTCWTTKEKYQAKDITYVDKNGNNRSYDVDINTLRPAYIGEANIVNFLKALFNIPDMQVWDNSARTFVPNPKLNGDFTKCKFWTKEDTEKLFKGNFKELKEAVKACNKLGNCVINYFYQESSDSTGKEYQKMIDSITLKPSFSLNGAKKQFQKEVDRIKAYYQNSNPAKLSQLKLDYVDIVRQITIKPTDYTANNEAPTIEDVPIASNDELPF